MAKDEIMVVSASISAVVTLFTCIFTASRISTIEAQINRLVEAYRRQEHSNRQTVDLNTQDSYDEDPEDEDEDEDEDDPPDRFLRLEQQVARLTSIVKELQASRPNRFQVILEEDRQKEELDPPDVK